MMPMSIHGIARKCLLLPDATMFGSTSLVGTSGVNETFAFMKTSGSTPCNFDGHGVATTRKEHGNVCNWNVYRSSEPTVDHQRCMRAEVDVAGIRDCVCDRRASMTDRVESLLIARVHRPNTYLRVHYP